MTKKLNEEAIQNELRGGSVFFRPTSPKEQLPTTQTDRESVQTIPTLRQQTKRSNNQEINTTNSVTSTQEKQLSRNHLSKQVSNMTILQFLSDADIEQLREPAYQAQTFRLTNNETEWVKDTAYKLSKKIKRGKVSQADIVRLSFKLFEKLLTTNESDLHSILERIK